MMLSYSTEIHVPPDELWPVLCEAEYQKLWMKGLIDVQTVAGDGSAGTRFKMKIQEGTKVVEYDGEIVAFHPPRHLAMRLRGGSLKPGWSMVANYKLANRITTTELDYGCWLEAPRVSLITRLLLPLFKLGGWIQSKSALKELKEVAEQQHVG